mmetsp:Transcript_31381/g.83047  ORF Transcript_31381/g.83047 Transcript_31381/m.83047 type:complete len:289 (-) Transcript_31381:133-999(-)
MAASDHALAVAVLASATTRGTAAARPWRGRRMVWYGMTGHAPCLEDLGEATRSLGLLVEGLLLLPVARERLPNHVLLLQLRGALVVHLLLQAVQQELLARAFRLARRGDLGLLGRHLLVKGAFERPLELLLERQVEPLLHGVRALGRWVDRKEVVVPLLLEGGPLLVHLLLQALIQLVLLRLLAHLALHVQLLRELLSRVDVGLLPFELHGLLVQCILKPRKRLLQVSVHHPRVRPRARRHGHLRRRKLGKDGDRILRLAAGAAPAFPRPRSHPRARARPIPPHAYAS